MTADHPHHMLYTLIALENGDDPSDGKIPASAAILARAAAECRDSVPPREDMSVLVADARRLRMAYVETGKRSKHVKASKEREGVLNPRTDAVARIGSSAEDTLNVVVPTADIPLRGDLDYGSAPRVFGFDERWFSPGGINCPIALVCVAQDGTRHKQLVKGNDDLRQDAVMQQLFTMINDLLRRDTEAARRMLAVRTYAVVPLDPLYGLVQWVDRCIPLSQYLFHEKDSAHSRRRLPGHMTHGDAQLRIKGAAEALKKGGPDLRLDALLDVYRAYPPVMRYFFREHYPDPAEWFERRVAYTRSAAAASMVGYVVGLGDRHSSNILIDTCTAELVHIDLGIAFDAGRFQTTPEVVPFRLTRDIIDGMGILGVEGPFRRCAERTLDLLRRSHRLLMTIAQVLVHDPLFRWSRKDTDAVEPSVAGEQVGPGDAARDTTGSEWAHAVLVALAAKLSGETLGRRISVRAQVAHLIEDARAPANLCRMYFGWAPFA
jgi:ataxia telangiectasia mutated family protein